MYESYKMDWMWVTDYHSTNTRMLRKCIFNCWLLYIELHIVEKSICKEVFIAFSWWFSCPISAPKIAHIRRIIHSNALHTHTLVVVSLFKLISSRRRSPLVFGHVPLEVYFLSYHSIKGPGQTQPRCKKENAHKRWRRKRTPEKSASAKRAVK